MHGLFFLTSSTPCADSPRPWTARRCWAPARPSGASPGGTPRPRPPPWRPALRMLKWPRGWGHRLWGLWGLWGILIWFIFDSYLIIFDHISMMLPELCSENWWKHLNNLKVSSNCSWCINWWRHGKTMPNSCQQIMFAFHTLGLRTIKPRMAKRTDRLLLGMVGNEVPRSDGCMAGFNCHDLSHVPDDRWCHGGQLILLRRGRSDYKLYSL